MQVYPRFISAVFALLGSFFAMTMTVHAQIFDDASSAQLVTSPEYPAPHSAVTISLEAYSMNTSGATVWWYVDGAERADARNARSMTLTTGDLGDRLVVTVKVIPSSGRTITLTHTINPSEVDLVVEANTYVPAFYKGRALPSGESVVRAIAIPHSAPSVSISSLTYEWTQGDTVLFGGPVKGKYSADITMSRFDDDYLRVRVTNASGQAIGGKTIQLLPIEPELHFYEENPLRGLNSKAIRDSLMLIGDETTIHAEPYFMTTNLTPSSITFDWKINDVAVTTNQADAHTLTLRRIGNGGSANIGVNALTRTVIPQYVQKTFTVMF